MNPDSSTRPPGAWRPWLLALALWLTLAAVAALALWQLHRAALDSQKREVTLLSLALADDLDRGLRGVEEGLQALGMELDPQRLAASGPDTGPALRTRAALMPLVDSLWLLGPDQCLIAASDDSPPPDTSAFLPALGSLPAGGTALSRTTPQTPEHPAQVVLALRVGASPAVAGGWILASIPADRLLGAFGAALPDTDARMAIFRGDGARLVGTMKPSTPREEERLARSFADRPPIELRRLTDGSESLVGWHPVPRYGLHVVVSREIRAALADWRGSLELTLGALAFLLIGMALAVHTVTRAERRRLLAQKALQVQLARTSKLEALGALAGGVSHDFNNVLAGIVGYGEMAQDAAPPGSDQARHLDRLLKAAQRGRLLIERILSFSRGGARASMVFELEPVVEEVLTLLAASLRPGIVLERVLEAPGARLRGDATQAFEAVMNLCTNAIQAMPEGGMVSVHLRRRLVDAAEVLSHTPLPAGRYLVLSVNDQGVGITPDVMEHLFEPFFTARGVGQTGTGLGLAVTFGVVAELGGGIDVQSTPGHGARFTLYLPECLDAVDGTPPGGQALPQGAGQHLLVLDDDPALRALAEEMLRGLGYQPACFSDAGQALAAVAADPARFAAAITDEVMPGTSGTQFTQSLRRLVPDLPVLLVSGYGGALLARRASDAGVTRVLMKPLRRDDLARALAELLRPQKL